jgi:2-octaprenyl-6-methoxyphenol hydroxylase
LNIKNFDESLSLIKKIEVSDQGHIGFHSMTPNAAPLKRFGGVISNRMFGECLNKRTENIAAQRFTETEVLKIQPVTNGHQLSLSCDKKVEAKLVILCDGGRSQLAEKIGLYHKTHDFHAKARVATVKTTLPHHGVAFERFTSYGPVALLPFGEFSTLVWTVPNQHRTHLPSTLEDSIPWLNEHFGQRLGRITELSDWVEYPLQERLLTTNVAHGIIALGNTAATLHPVAGQGFNLAIRGIKRTAQLINQQFEANQTIPDFQQLNGLARQISEDQTITAQLSKELIRVFGSANPAIQLARGIGLNSLDRHPSFSQLLALAGMGYLANTAVPARNVHRELV